MAFFLTLLYILTAYLTPQTIFGALADYHIEVVVAVFTLIGSLFASDKPPLTRMPQVHVLIGLTIAVFLSIATSGWLGGAQGALLNFFPNVFVFFFIVINCRTKRHVQMVVLTLLFACLFVIFMGSTAYFSGNDTSPYLFHMHDDEGDTFMRLNGLGFINDPNDFAQVVVCLVPCLFFFWKPKRSFLNTIFVIVPLAILVFGLYLTHSRGGMLALLAVVAIVARRRIGTVPSIVIAGSLLAATLAIGWAGNRGISVEAGADRMDAWAAGLDMIKQHPIFGVGFSGFTDHYPLTAHNTIVVCAAEMGMVGLYLWLLFVCSALWEAMTVGGPLKAKPKAKEEEVMLPYGLGPGAQFRFTAPMQAASATGLADSSLALAAGTAISFSSVKVAEATPNQEDIASAAAEDIRRMGRIMIISMSGFLVAGWFLSRAVQMTVFVLGGIVEVIYQLAVQQGIAPAQMPMKKLMRVTFYAAIGLVTAVYLMLRVEHAMGIL